MDSSGRVPHSEQKQQSGSRSFSQVTLLFPSSGLMPSICSPIHTVPTCISYFRSEMFIHTTPKGHFEYVLTQQSEQKSDNHHVSLKPNLAGWGTLQSWTIAQKMTSYVRAMPKGNHWSHKKLSWWQHASPINKHLTHIRDENFPAQFLNSAPRAPFNSIFIVEVGSRSHHTSIWVSCFLHRIIPNYRVKTWENHQ